MSPLNPTKKETKDPLIPEGVKPEQVSEAQLHEAEAEEEQFHEKITEAKEAVEKQSAQEHEQALDLESSQHLAAQTAAPIDPQLKAVRDVLQEDIYELYSQMLPAEQEKFRDEGLRVAGTIKGLLGAVKVNVKKIVELIGAWLSRLPGINKYFIKQESKIKLDKLLQIKKQQQEQAAQQMEQASKK